MTFLRPRGNPLQHIMFAMCPVFKFAPCNFVHILNFIDIDVFYEYTDMRARSADNLYGRVRKFLLFLSGLTTKIAFV